MTQSLNVERKDQTIERDPSRVICRPLIHGVNPARSKSILGRVLKLDDEQTRLLLNEVLRDFADRHINIRAIFNRNFQRVENYIPEDCVLTRERELLIGAYFTMEYSIESAALFNPSIVPHPDQTKLTEGSLRFIMSLRAVGEGHISSMVFRCGTINQDGELAFDPASSFVDTPLVSNPVFDRDLFQPKLKEIGTFNEVAEYIMNHQEIHD